MIYLSTSRGHRWFPRVTIYIFTYIYTDVGVGKDGVLAPYETLIPLYLPNTDLVYVISNSVLHGHIGRQGWYLHPYFYLIHFSGEMTQHHVLAYHIVVVPSGVTDTTTHYL